MIARLLVVMAFALPSPAAAQDLHVPGRLDLNGLWELTEHGAIVDGPAIVRITHSGSSVHAEFIAGAGCEAGGTRPYAFLAELRAEPTNPPSGTLSSPGMWVCSGSPAAVRKCGRALPASYQAPFTNATVDQDYIAGHRFQQGYRECSLDASANGTVDFSLRRLQPCELEERRFRKSESDLRDLQLSLFSAGGLFANAIAAARERYGETFRNQPTDTLKYPYQTTNVSGDLLATEAFFQATPDLFESSDWTNAREMARAMAGDTPPLAEAARMLQEMIRIEALGAEGRRAQAEYQSAKAAFERCRKAQQ